MKSGTFTRSYFFFSCVCSLSYVNTMEVLEIANVELFCAEEVVVPAAKRSELLCVVWEGTLVERDCTGSERITDKPDESNSDLSSDVEGGSADEKDLLTVWHAGDWTGPVALQPDFDRSADKSTLERPRDIVAVSQEGVKVSPIIARFFSLRAKLFSWMHQCVWLCRRSFY